MIDIGKLDKFIEYRVLNLENSTISQIQGNTALNIEWIDFVMLIEIETHLRANNCA